jgi:hypothetical protein
MAFTSIGYDGTVNERQWAELVPSAGSSTYGIKEADDLKVTAVPGQPLMLSVASGTGWGHGVMDTETANTTITCDAITSGSRWDLIALRRNWQPLAGGPTSAVKVTGTFEKKIPDARKVQPGVEDDQPLALVQWTAGQTQPTQIIDLRCWAGNGGVVANDLLALGYLSKPGASVLIAGERWDYIIGPNDIASWVKSVALGRIPLFGSSGRTTPTAGAQGLIQAGSAVLMQEVNGYGTIWLPNAFPNGIISATVTNGDIQATGRGWQAALNAASGAALFVNLSNGNGVGYSGGLWRCDYIAVGW